ncbi:phage tail protein I [Pluralibacter gergoviae]|uniref:phage tail protein I n=1 Tax=Pluralibacter gergoviae TaxID=61647 RepID=UPI0021F47AA4|nr:phage tail protein I [Pluralibacter gergoviae]MCV7756988.1 phage tail protein I [Pluralibacter gergoviae]
MNSSMLPPGASALEMRLAAACASISGLDVPLRDLWNPWRCPAQFLPYLAWAFSVDRWEESWSVAAKRQAVGDAFWIHQRKGTVAAVERVIESLGYSMEISEWWTTSDPAGTFRLSIDVKDVGITESMIDELERIIGDAKPVSRHISNLEISARSQGEIYVGCSAPDGEIINVFPGDYTPPDCIFYDGVAHYDGNYHYCTGGSLATGALKYDGSAFYDGFQRYDGIYILR